MSATQKYTRSLTSSGRPMNHQEDMNVRMKSQRRILKIPHYEDVHVDAKCLGDSSLEILDDPMHANGDEEN